MYEIKDGEIEFSNSIYSNRTYVYNPDNESALNAMYEYYQNSPSFPTSTKTTITLDNGQTIQIVKYKSHAWLEQDGDMIDDPKFFKDFTEDDKKQFKRISQNQFNPTLESYIAKAKPPIPPAPKNPAATLTEEKIKNFKTKNKIIEFNDRSIYYSNEKFTNFMKDAMTAYLGSSAIVQGIDRENLNVSDSGEYLSDTIKLNLTHVYAINMKTGEYTDWFEVPEPKGMVIDEPAFFQNLTRENVIHLAKRTSNPIIIDQLLKNKNLSEVDKKEIKGWGLEMDLAIQNEVFLPENKRTPATLKYLEKFKDNPVFIARWENKIKAEVAKDPTCWERLNLPPFKLKTLNLGPNTRLDPNVLDKLITTFNEKSNRIIVLNTDLSAKFIKDNLLEIDNQESLVEIIRQQKPSDDKREISDMQALLGQVQTKRLKANADSQINEDVLASFTLDDVLAVYKHCVHAGRIGGLFSERVELVEALQRQVSKLAKEFKPKNDKNDMTDFDRIKAFFKENIDNKDLDLLLSTHKGLFGFRRTSIFQAASILKQDGATKEELGQAEQTILNKVTKRPN